jgi:hypothetical protein
MAQPDLLNEVSDADVTDIMAALLVVRTKLPFLLNLSKNDRKRLRKMGIKFEGYVKENLEAAQSFPNAIPDAYPIDNQKKKYKLYDVLTGIANEHYSIGEAINDTRLLLGSQLVSTSDIYYSSLKNAAKGNITMAEALAKISGIFKRKPPSQPKEFNIPSGGTLNITNVATGTKLVVRGNGVIRYKAGNELAGKVKEPARIVNPNSSDTIPSGWTSIEVVNLSQTDDTTILVRVR